MYKLEYVVEDLSMYCSICCVSESIEKLLNWARA